VYEARWDKGGAEPTEGYVFFSVEKVVKFRWRRSSILAVTVAEFGGCSMMFNCGVIFRMRMSQLTIKVITQWGTVRNYTSSVSRGSYVTRFQFRFV